MSLKEELHARDILACDIVDTNLCARTLNDMWHFCRAPLLLVPCHHPTVFCSLSRSLCLRTMFFRKLSIFSIGRSSQRISWRGCREFCTESFSFQSLISFFVTTPPYSVLSADLCAYEQCSLEAVHFFNWTFFAKNLLERPSRVLHWMFFLQILDFFLCHHPLYSVLWADLCAYEQCSLWSCPFSQLDVLRKESLGEVK